MGELSSKQASITKMYALCVHLINKNIYSNKLKIKFQMKVFIFTKKYLKNKISSLIIGLCGTTIAITIAFGDKIRNEDV